MGWVLLVVVSYTILRWREKDGVWRLWWVAAAVLAFSFTDVGIELMTDVSPWFYLLLPGSVLTMVGLSLATALMDLGNKFRPTPPQSLVHDHGFGPHDHPHTGVHWHNGYDDNIPLYPTPRRDQ